jgi:hypothetical protein
MNYFSNLTLSNQIQHSLAQPMFIPPLERCVCIYMYGILYAFIVKHFYIYVLYHIYCCLLMWWYFSQDHSL